MDFSTFNLLFRCSRRYSHTRLRSSDLSETECMICSRLYGGYACTQDTLVRNLGMDKTTVAKACLRLEEKGMLIRSPGEEDRRTRLAALTDAGKEKMADLAGLHDRWLRGVLDGLSLEEQRTFETLCAKLLARAEELEYEEKDG